MEIVINIEDYLSHGEIKDIVKDAIKREISYIVKRDAERILNNAAYYVVFKAVDEALDNNAKELIKKKAIDLINDLSPFYVFRERDIWQKEDSLGYKFLQEAINENKDLIKQKVREIIENRDYEEDIRYSGDYVAETLIEVIKRGVKSYD